MDTLEALIQRVQKTQHGFIDIKRAADEVIRDSDRATSLCMATALFEQDAYQARMLAVYILGRHAAQSADSLRFLRERVSQDPSWQVQEILAQAFDQYCADMTYEKALPTLKAWLADPSANVRRAASEGPRIWTNRPYFREHPQVALTLLSALRADESEYVRKSAGNAIRDISRKHAAMVRVELVHWDLTDAHTRQTHTLAARFL